MLERAQINTKQTNDKSSGKQQPGVFMEGGRGQETL